MSRRRKVAIALGVIALAAACRVALEPQRIVRPDVVPDEAARARFEAVLRASAIDREALVAELAARRIVLVGESHFLREPPEWLLETLAAMHARDGRKTVLLLELPGRFQPALDDYAARGDEAALAAAWPSEGLPYMDIVRWARAHPGIVARVIADDESAIRFIAQRTFLARDTRNVTMAAAIVQTAKDFPAARIVAYGGSSHMTMAGRYLYDTSSRRPVGARLVDAGIPRREIAAVWVGCGRGPRRVWPEEAAVRLDGAAGALPAALTPTDPVTGVERLGELGDFAVDLGPGTRVAR